MPLVFIEAIEFMIVFTTGMLLRALPNTSHDTPFLKPWGEFSHVSAPKTDYTSPEQFLNLYLMHTVNILPHCAFDFALPARKLRFILGLSFSCQTKSYLQAFCEFLLPLISFYFACPDFSFILVFSLIVKDFIKYFSNVL